jgi:uncharacterized DUF497 family protein
MPWRHLIWTDIACEKIAAHGVSEHEVEEVVLTARCMTFSRSSGLPLYIGHTHAGRRLCVVFREVDEVTIEILTAYEPQAR